MPTLLESYNILVIEDDLSEQKLIKLIFKNFDFPVILKFLNDGEEAKEYLKSFPANEEIMNKLHLIFLDLNLPKIHGLDILRMLKQSEILNKVPVIVLTTSNNSRDVDEAYSAGASGYIRKPSSIEEYEEVFNKILNYWLNACILP
jgi:CheY-like chemotaxis protein